MTFPVMSIATRIFYSYAKGVSRDKVLLKKLKNQLSLARRQGLIDDRYDSESAMQSREDRSDGTHLIDEADIIVLLVSSEYFASEYCVNIEMQRALERHETRGALLIPILLRDTDWKKSPLNKYRMLPLDEKPVQRKNIDIDSILVEIGKEICRAAEKRAGAADTRSRLETPFPINTLPPGPVRFFTDRKEILAALYTYFTSFQASQQTCIQALNGMPGSGKTQIAVQYVHFHKHEYRTILWLEAASRHTLSEAIVPLAESLAFHVQDRVDEHHLFAALSRWLEQHNEWLLSLDDLRDFQLLDRFIPFYSNGHILLTTYSHATGERAHPVPVPEMTPEDSAVFLLRRAGLIGEQASRDEASELEYAQAIDIVEEFDGWTLALDQAGAYIEETGCDLPRYLELYRSDGMELLARRGRLARAHSKSVMVTLLLAFKEIELECPRALELLHLFAFLHPDAIPDIMIEQGAAALDGSLQTLATKAVALNEAIAVLLRFSLVQRHSDNTMLRMHRVVQAILRGGLMRRKQRQWATKVVRLVNRIFPQAEFDNWSIWEPYVSQARHCAELITTFELKQKEAAHLLQRLGTYCYHHAYYRDAEEYLTSALQLFQEEIGTDRSATALTLNNLALVYYSQGKYHEAEDLYLQALDIREQIFGADHPAVSQTLNNLALVYYRQSKYDEAEDLYQRALRIDEQPVGPDHPDVAVSLSNLALVYDELGKYFQAEQLYQRAFAIEEHTLNADHPNLALSWNEQARQSEEQGHYQEAETLYQRALALQRRSLGKKHPDIALTLNNLANLYRELDRYREAETLYRQALDIARQTLGPKHPTIASILNNRGYLLRQQGRYQEAEVLYRQALTLYEQTRGDGHPDTADVLNNLGRLYHLMDKDELAEPLLRRGLDIRERVFGPEHLRTCESLSALVELLIHQRLYEQAEPLYRRVLYISQQISGSAAPDVVLLQERYTMLLVYINEQKQR